MGCLMKIGMATDSSLSHDYFILQINGCACSIHGRYEDAVREGLLRRYQFPQDKIQVCQISLSEDAEQNTVLH